MRFKGTSVIASKLGGIMAGPSHLVHQVLRLVKELITIDKSLLRFYSSVFLLLLQELLKQLL